MPEWLVAYGWGALIGFTLFLWACLAYFVELSHRQIATVMGVPHSFMGLAAVVGFISCFLFTKLWI